MRLNLSAPVPPVAVTVSLYGMLIVQLGSVDVLNEIRGLTVTV